MFLNSAQDPNIIDTNDTDLTDAFDTNMMLVQECMDNMITPLPLSSPLRTLAKIWEKICKSEKKDTEEYHKLMCNLQTYEHMYEA